MNKMLSYSKSFVKRNSSTILTTIGGVGVAATSVMAVRATPKALKLLDQAKEEKGDELTKFEVVRAAGPVYIPAILIGASTIACIFGANAISKRHQASLMSAYALLDSSYKEYKNKVNELYGEDADDTIRKSIAEDQYEERGLAVIANGKQLYYDRFSERYFESTENDVLRAEYILATAVINNTGASVNTFYDALGLVHEKAYDEFGWSWNKNEEMYWTAWTAFQHDKLTMGDGTDYTIITMPFEPLIDYLYY